MDTDEICVAISMSREIQNGAIQSCQAFGYAKQWLLISCSFLLSRPPDGVKYGTTFVVVEF